MAEQSGRASSLFIGSLEKAFRVLHAFDDPRRRLTLADLSRAAGLDRSATQRIIFTLEELGYVSRIEGTKTYSLTPRMLQFSLNYIRSNELIDKASPYLLEASRELGETANLHLLDRHEIVFLARFPGRHLFNVDYAVGSRLPAVFTSSGTAILSQFAEEERRAFIGQTPLERMTPFTDIEPETLLHRIALAEEEGFAMTMNQTVMGDISIASAITDERGRAVAAFNISVPTTRWTLERVKEELATHVQVAAAAISRTKL